MPNSPVTRERHPNPSATGQPAGGIQRPLGHAEHPSGLAIIGAKIDPAVPARAILARARLVDWFAQHAGARLILVSAEAGYGKTTLLTEFAFQTRDACAWYRLERSDRDWITFLSYMVATLRGVWPGFGKATEALLRSVASMGSSREVVLAQFLADLSSAGPRRVAVILDDYHVVEDSPDVRMIMSRMLELAPEGMYFILGGRGAPNLALGRLTAQGRVHGLTIDDLRFSLDEIERLFSETYRQPLSLDTCRMIAERTEGWAAGLQLVAASISVSKPSEVADFIEALSGATGPIYDFLAEEVLTRLTPQTQQVLMHASLMDRIRPEYVLAAMAAGGRKSDSEQVQDALDAVESIGLLSLRSGSPSGWRLQALFREFLAVQLEVEASPASMRDMHRAIAAAAESSDWLMSAFHYAHAGAPAEAMRVLGSAASEALGNGAWGAAVHVLSLMPSATPPAAVKVIQARALLSEQRADAAGLLLSELDSRRLTHEEQGLVGLTQAAIHHMNGDGPRLRAVVESIAADAGIPESLHDIAAAWRLVINAMSGGCISDATQALRALAVEQRRANLQYFAGVSLHNSAYGELARGNYLEARDISRQALACFELADGNTGITASTRSTEATAIAELGDIEEGLRLADAAATEPGATADAIADAVYVHAICGRLRRARILYARYERGDSRWPRELGAQAQGLFGRVALAMSAGDLMDAEAALHELQLAELQTIDSKSRIAVVAATLAVVARAPDAKSLVDAALETAASQHAWRWMARARLLQAVAQRDGEGLATWIAEYETESSLALLELADAIASAISVLAPIPEALERSILREPSRWVAAFGRQVEGRSLDAGAAAALVARYGTAEDAPLLRSYDQTGSSRTKKRGLANQLVRRVSPTVRVHDLGLTSCDVGDRTITLTETRRKSAALLLFLVTRRDLAANREQAMEALWPDQSPKSALNSLHQTIFFLRRELEPWYEDGSTAEYIHMDSELVRLDSELFQVDSIAFARQATDIIARNAATSRGPEMLALYRGHFAPEFEYEEWASDYRTHLHATYLRLAWMVSSALVTEKRFGEAVEILTPVTTVDPGAFELRAVLVGCLAMAGARDAAVAHYRSLASAQERELGVTPPPLVELIRAVSL